MYPLVRPVVTYNWRFVDAAWVWTLTREPLSSFMRKIGPFDQDSFMFQDSSSAALLYAFATFPPFPIFPGYLGMTSYTPPALKGSKVLVAQDIRWPFDSPQTNEELWIPVRRPERWRLYCDVVQTDPVNRNSIATTPTDVRQVEGLPPEEEFLAWLSGASKVAVGAQVWRVHGRLITQKSQREPER
jgi:hypothetical protein